MKVLLNIVVFLMFVCMLILSGESTNWRAFVESKLVATAALLVLLVIFFGVKRRVERKDDR